MNPRTKWLDEIIGWYGATALISAYALISFGVLTVEQFIYPFLNVTGAIGIVYISIKKRAYQPAALNLIWTIIGLIALIKIGF